MQVHWIDWTIMIIPTLCIVGLAIYTKKYVNGVADFLAAGRVAGRYVLSVGEMSSGLSVITLVGLVEAKYQTGFATDFWGNLLAPIGLIFALTGFCIYRWRETKALSFGQFLEMRYNRAFRIFAASLRTISEMIANALGPAIAANFFIYFLGLPHKVMIFGINLPSFAILLVILMTLAMTCIWPGGRVSLMITDTFQGILSYPVFVVIVGYVLLTISWGGEMAPTLADRAAGENFLNPYDIEKLRDFNVFAILVNIIGIVLNRASWFGNDGTNCGKTPHEQKMAGILGAWRNGFSMLMFSVLAVMIITIMNNKNFAGDAKIIRDDLTKKVATETISLDKQKELISAITSLGEQQHNIGVDLPLSQTDNLDTRIFDKAQSVLGNDGTSRHELQKFRTLYQQQMMAVTFNKKFPVGITGLFGLLMIMLVISTDDSRIFNASSTLIQDIVVPLKKKAMSPKQHLLSLRLASVGVALFFLLFSLLFVQVDYINMFLAIVCSIWLGGAGPVMLFGLYSRFGNSTGAFSAIIVGSGISAIGIWLQQSWAKTIYPFLVANNLHDSVATSLEYCSAPFNPIVVWTMNPDKFPINSFEIYAIAMILGILAYILGSLITFKHPYNLDRLLHRGIYNIDGDSKNIRFEWSWKTVWDKLIGITPDYSRSDKIITWSVFLYSFVYQVLIGFVLVVVWNIITPWPMEYWSLYFLWSVLIIPGVSGIITTVWFIWGGIKDTLQLFKDLEARLDNPLDDGRVEGEVSVADLNAMEHLSE